jgi:hypothetical protein
MTDTKKMIWGIFGFIFALGVIYWGIKSIIDGIMLLAIVFFIGAIIGIYIAIKEIKTALKS